MTNYKTEKYKSRSSCLISGRGDPSDGINSIGRRAEEMFRPNHGTRFTCKHSVCQDFVFHIEAWKFMISVWIYHPGDRSLVEPEWMIRKWLLSKNAISGFS